LFFLLTIVFEHFIDPRHQCTTRYYLFDDSGLRTINEPIFYLEKTFVT